MTPPPQQGLGQVVLENEEVKLEPLGRLGYVGLLERLEREWLELEWAMQEWLGQVGLLKRLVLEQLGQARLVLDWLGQERLKLEPLGQVGLREWLERDWLEQQLLKREWLEQLGEVRLEPEPLERETASYMGMLKWSEPLEWEWLGYVGMLKWLEWERLEPVQLKLEPLGQVRLVQEWLGQVRLLQDWLGQERLVQEWLGQVRLLQEWLWQEQLVQERPEVCDSRGILYVHNGIAEEELFCYHGSHSATFSQPETGIHSDQSSCIHSDFSNSDLLSPSVHSDQSPSVHSDQSLSSESVDSAILGPSKTGNHSVLCFLTTGKRPDSDIDNELKVPVPVFRACGHYLGGPPRPHYQREELA